MQVARTIFKKRKNDAIKVSVPNDVDAYTVINGSNDRAPAVWPPSNGAVDQALENFKSTPELDASQDKLGQPVIAQPSVTKADGNVAGLEKKSLTTHDLLNEKPVEQDAVAEARDMVCLLDDKLRDLWGSQPSGPELQSYGGSGIIGGF